MLVQDDQDDGIYEVVVNGEGQYSIWPSEKTLPLGWEKVGKQGTKIACLEYIDQTWTDMRPRSLREQTREPIPPLN